MELLSTRPLLAIGVLVALAWLSRYTLVDQPAWQRWSGSALRGLGMVLLIVAICRPYWLCTTDKVHVVFVVDASQSVDLDAMIQAADEIQFGIEALRSSDSWSLLMMGKSLRTCPDPAELKKRAEAWRTGLADDEFRSATPIGSSLLDARLFFPAGKARRLILFSDGHDTEGHVAECMAHLRQEAIDVQWHKLETLRAAEGAVVGIRPSTRRAFLGETVQFDVEIVANRPLQGQLRLVHQGVVIQQRNVQLADAKTHAFDFDVPVFTLGTSSWTAEFLPADDHYLINNQMRCQLLVQGKPRLLVLHEEPSELREMQRALAEQNIDLDIRGTQGLPEEMDEILSFDGIVLANIPATAFTQRQMQSLKSYVSDFGGGLIMVGSENSFGLGGYYQTPIEEVLPLTSRFEKEKEKPSLAMVLVIDKSGSMEGVPMELARQAAKAAVELLSDRDTIAVVGFDGEPVVTCEMTSVADRGTIQSAIDSLAASGGTFMYPALELARDMLANTSAKIQHVIALSDGHTQPADHDRLVQEMADAGMTFSAVALGDADRQLLASLTEIGRGRFYETNRPENVPQIFTQETMQASRSAIKEDLFESIVVGDHALLAGYEKVDLPNTMGYVMTEAKPTAQLLLATEAGDPLLAVSRFGLGTGVAFTGDWSERWGAEWLSWDGCGAFCAGYCGTVRTIDTAGFRVTDHVDDITWSVELSRTDDNDQPLAGIDWNVVAIDDTGQEQSLPVTEVGLGRYKLQASLGNARTMSIRIHDEDHNRVQVLSYASSYPLEYRLTQEVPSAIASLPASSLARIREELPATRTRASAAPIPYLAALVCFLASILVRRL